MNELGLLLTAKSLWTAAEPLFRRALAINEPDHPNVVGDLNSLAQLLKDTNRLAEAEPLLRQALEIFLHFTAATGHEHPHLRTVIGNFSALLEAMGRSREEIEAQLKQIEKPFGL